MNDMNELWKRKLLGTVNEAPVDEGVEFDEQDFYIDVVKLGGISLSIEKITFKKDTLVVHDEDGNIHTLSEWAHEKLAKKYFNGKPFVFTDSFDSSDKKAQMTNFTHEKTFRLT